MKFFKQHDELRDYQVMPVCAYGHQYFRMPKANTKNKIKLFRLFKNKRKHSEKNG